MPRVSKRFVVCSTVATLAVVASGCGRTSASEGLQQAGELVAERRTIDFRGVTIADNPPDYTSEACMLLADSLLYANVSSVAITPCGYIDSVQSVTIRWTEWSKRDYVTGIKKLKQRGFTVLVKPYLWSMEFWTKRKWTGDIVHHDAASRTAFFTAYERFILDNARYAEEGGADILCIGLELPNMTRYESAWRSIIAEIRKIYRGKLTYAAHGLAEARSIAFWDALDIVGINAYPTLSHDANATEEALESGCRAFCDDVNVFWEKQQRPDIVLTEIGFRSVERAWYSPWEWPEHAARKVNVEHQAIAYRVLGKILADEPWFRGVYWWKVFTDEQRPDEGPDGFTPQRKPAWQEMRRAFQVMSRR